MNTRQLRSRTAAVLFDLDGTLVDTAEDFVQVLNVLRARYGLDALPPLKIRNTVSDGARALTALAFGGQEGEPKFEQQRQELLDLYLLEVGTHARLFQGMPETLVALERSGIPWGIVTNKPRVYTERLLQRLALSENCRVLVCPDDVQQAKPNPEGLLLAASTLGIAPSTCVYVGDHVRDIEAGKAAGMRTVAAKFGYIDSPDIVQTWQADFVIEQASALTACLQIR